MTYFSQLEPLTRSSIFDQTLSHSCQTRGCATHIQNASESEVKWEEARRHHLLPTMYNAPRLIFYSTVYILFLDRCLELATDTMFAVVAWAWCTETRRAK